MTEQGPHPEDERLPANEPAPAVDEETSDLRRRFGREHAAAGLTAHTQPLSSGAAARNRLVGRMAALAKRYEAGEISEATYTAKKAELSAQL